MAASAQAQDQAGQARREWTGASSLLGTHATLDPIEVAPRSGHSRFAEGLVPGERVNMGSLSTMRLDLDAAGSDSDLSLEPASGTTGLGISAAAESGGWSVDLVAYVWLPIRMDGVSSVAGVNVPLDFNLGDVFDNFKPIGLAGRVEAWYDDQFGIIFDASYVRLESEGFALPTPTPTPFELTIQQGIIDLAGGWRVMKPSASDGGSRIWVDLIGGLRWQYLDQSIDFNVAPSLGGSEDFFEPLVGARFVWGASDTWSLMVRGDASGFGVGSASDLTWNLVAGAMWNVTDRFSLQLAYKYQSIDYDNEVQGPSQIGLDMDLHGPYVGFAFEF
jgi:opacity protein-like surface antigen